LIQTADESYFVRIFHILIFKRAPNGLQITPNWFAKGALLKSY